MGGSSSQLNMEQLMSPIHTFPIEDMYTLEFSDSFQHTYSFQETAREDSPVEVAAPPPKAKSKPTRGRQKRTIENEDAPRQTAWTNAVENEEGYDAGCRTYDMVNGKWKTVCPAVVRFCEVYGNVMHRLQESGVGDEDYFNRALLDYEAETEVSFKLRHCSDKRYKTYGSSSFNAEYREASINMNVDVGDDDGDEVQFDDRLAGTKRKEYRQHQEDIRFYLQPYDHLIGYARTAMEALRAEIKAKYNLPY
ncbi:hypothetical protein Tco_1435967 [Tanacetum coccineum]